MSDQCQNNSRELLLRYAEKVEGSGHFRKALRNARRSHYTLRGHVFLLGGRRICRSSFEDIFTPVYMTLARAIVCDCTFNLCVDACVFDVCERVFLTSTQQLFLTVSPSCPCTYHNLISPHGVTCLVIYDTRERKRYQHFCLCRPWPRDLHIGTY